MSGKSERPIIIVKRIKRGEEAHHGGAWKVAYADFVTAMMAFFLVMWLIASVSKDQRAAIFEYFRNPSMEQGKSARPSPGQQGPGGASTSVINLGGALDARRSETPLSTGLGTPRITPAKQDQSAAHDLDEARRLMQEAERRKLESLMAELRQAIDKSQALKPFKDQLLLDLTPEGLRIQIVDAQNRPMFDLGRSKLKPYTANILHVLAPYLESVPNRLSLSGHTDTTPYTAQAGYNNWDLSADRANAARRALEAGGLSADKVVQVVGLSSAVLFDQQNPRDPINRRISIIVLTKDAEQNALKTDAPTVQGKDLSKALGVAAGAAGTGGGGSADTGVTLSAGTASGTRTGATAAAPAATAAAPAATASPGGPPGGAPAAPPR